MSKIGERVGLVAAVWGLIARYPALSAGLAQIVIVLGAAFGLDLTAAQLASGASFIAALFGLLVSAGVIPVTKVANVKAGLKSTVPHDVVVATPEVAATPAPVQPVAKLPFVIETPPADPPKNPWKGN